MKLNSSYMLFSLVMLTSLILISSSYSWLGVWVGLEINLMSFVPLLASGESHYKAPSSFKYFLVQSLGTIFLLISIFITIFPSEESKLLQNTSLTISLLVKLGSSPFHMWIPRVMENMSWLNCFLTTTFQKLGPIIATSNLLITKFTMMIILLNLVIGPFGSFNQNSLRKLMAYSSINHTGWILLGIMEGFNYWTFYFINYTILNMMVI